MSGLNDKDWDLINAYHDGALSDAECRDLEARFETEPELEVALSDVAGVSASLRGLRPAMQSVPAEAKGRSANRNTAPMRWVAAGALAAGIALAITVGPSLLVGPSVFSIHEEFAANPNLTVRNDIHFVQTLESEGAPDLMGADLTVVAVQYLDTSSVAHYAGRNGCRLSYFQGSAALTPKQHPNGYQVASWETAPGIAHVIVASGMDQQKFDAIGSYLKLLTGSGPTNTQLTTMTEATEAATPCTGQQPHS